MASSNLIHKINHIQFLIIFSYLPALLTCLSLVYSWLINDLMLLGNPAIETFILYLLLGQFIERRLTKKQG